MSYREESRTLQQLVRELLELRGHNRGAAGAGTLPLAEAALTLLTLERFVRTLPGVNAANKESLPQLLQRAVAIRTLTLPAGTEMQVIDRVRRARNAILHSNFEQAAKKAGLGSVEEYFRSHFAGELEFLFGLTTELLAQVDPETGLRRPG
jgi:hypothetical protein